MAFLELGQLGQPCRLVDRVTDDRVLEPGLRADVAGDRAAGGDADAELVGAEHLDQLAVQFTSGRQRSARRVRVFQRCAEDRQRGVALELVDEPAVSVDRLDDHPEELVEQPDDLRRRLRGGELGGADQVDEQHGDVALLAAQLGAAFQRSPRDVLADVAAEQVAQPLPLGQLADHVVEPGLQQAELAGVVNLHVRVVVAALHLAECPPQLAQRIGDRHRGEDGAGQTDDQRCDRQ